ncbi:hypothetical protein NYE67_20665 [Solibacillus sp. FSL W8-0474]|uniref:hypothetical protein n=1 Tax=Solibacillus sp. FSL W8-0474 TaxID=2975336 RepID=UPI0030FA653D
MIYSQMDVMGIERYLINKRNEKRGFFKRNTNSIVTQRNPYYTFKFYVPKDIFIRAVSFCDRVSDQIEEEFGPEDLARVLYDDFLEFLDREYDYRMIYRQLEGRYLSPAANYHYTDDEVRNGVYFSEIRGFELIKTTLQHKTALRGELLLEDMNEEYPDHTFTLEGILEMVFCDFIEKCKHSLIDRPIDKIIQYVL